VPAAAIAMQTAFKWTVTNYFAVDARGIGFSTFFLPPAKPGAGSFYPGANFDSTGQPLRGESNYRLHVSPNVPVSEFWSATVYNPETSALFLNSTRPTIDSLAKAVQKNADGSVDVYFGQKAPAGHELTWIHAPAGRTFPPWFRFHGPEQAVFDKSWKMADIELVR